MMKLVDVRVGDVVEWNGEWKDADGEKHEEGTYVVEVACVDDSVLPVMIVVPALGDKQIWVTVNTLSPVKEG